LRVAQDFKWSPNTWYRLKAKVDRSPDGSAVVRAKAWKRDEAEPDAPEPGNPALARAQDGGEGRVGRVAHAAVPSVGHGSILSA
jgi:hypothetical protein